MLFATCWGTSEAVVSPNASLPSENQPFVWQESAPKSSTTPAQPADHVVSDSAPETKVNLSGLSAQNPQADEKNNLQNDAPDKMTDVPLAAVVKSIEPPAPSSENALQLTPIRMLVSLLGVLGLFWLVAEKVLKPMAARFNASSGSLSTAGSSKASPPIKKRLLQPIALPFFSFNPQASESADKAHHPASLLAHPLTVASSSTLAAEPPLIRMLGEQSLGGDRSVHLLQVHNRLLVVGASGQMMSVLSEFSESELPPACVAHPCDAERQEPPEFVLPDLPTQALPKAPSTKPLATTGKPLSATRAAKTATRVVKSSLMPSSLTQSHQERLILLPDYQETYQ
ncbi:MAG: flagellar biosynthetic protein FliO [Vampirovibrionales bacterium]|nr:flagellar biosynthetic protein FliO [Vampirovibrionales bacterium]